MSQSAAEVAKTLRVGDIIRLTQTVRVTGVAGRGDRITGVDVRDGYYVDYTPGPGSLQLEVVKKARRSRTDFKAGDIITGETIREVQWRRGTILHLKDTAFYEYALILNADGEWHPINGVWDKRYGADYQVGFDTFVSDASFELDYVA